MKRYVRFLFPLVVFVLFLTWQRHDTSKSLSIQPQVNNSYEVEKEEGIKEATPKIRNTSRQSHITRKEIEVLRQSFPDKTDVKSEVEDNQHRTPEALITFARTLGPLVDKAMKNRKDALLLVNELDDCVAAETVYVSAKTLCLSKAEQLANAYPDFKERLLQIRENSSEEGKELQRRKNSFIKD